MTPILMFDVAVAVPPTRFKFTVAKKSVEMTFWFGIVSAVLFVVTVPSAVVGQACK